MTKVMNLMYLHFLFYTFNVWEKLNIYAIWYLENTRYHDQSHKPSKLCSRYNDKSHAPKLKFSYIMNTIWN